MNSTTVSLAANVALVVVTGVYVVLTWRLARSSREAASSAAESATAAAESARAQRAAIETEAYQRHAWFKTGGGGASYDRWEIGVRPLVGAYLLRKVVLRDFQFMPEEPHENGVQSGVSVDVHQELVPKEGTLPRLVDEVEGVMFVVDVAGLAREAMPGRKWRIDNWSCEVTYSLSEFSDAQRRVIVYRDHKMDPRLHWLREAGELGLR